MSGYLRNFSETCTGCLGSELTKSPNVQLVSGIRKVKEGITFEIIAYTSKIVCLRRKQANRKNLKFINF